MITIEDVERAQQDWGEGIVGISRAYIRGEDYVKRAQDHIESLYAYNIGPVLFKPTFASEEQFRSTIDEALSYFVAENGLCPEDKGFAIKGWKKIRFENENIAINDVTAMAMGNYFFTTLEGNEVKVEYSFGYILDREGNLRIQLHHSSIPSGDN